MGYPPPGTAWVYAGMAHRWLADSMLHDAELVHLDPEVEVEPAGVQEPSQMPLMVLPESARKRVKMRGHAAIPGTGPEGETCGSCASYHVKRMAKTYRKCLLKKAAWTGGSRTDVRKGDAACAKWSVK